MPSGCTDATTLLLLPPERSDLLLLLLLPPPPPALLRAADALLEARLSTPLPCAGSLKPANASAAATPASAMVVC
jgi:hypothetical protein